MDVGSIGTAPTPTPRKTPQPTPVQAGTTTATMPSDSLSLKSKAPVLALPALTAGQQFKMQGEAKGTEFGGTATVKTRNDSLLEMSLNAQVLFFSKKIDLRIESRPDGSIKAAATQPGEDKPLFDGTFKLVSQKDGKAILKDADGKNATITQHANGALSIQLDTIKLDLKA
ncbi:hypothetical protein J7643_00035 [bacterium]|nr:hypothetical protein [bacterium]